MALTNLMEFLTTHNVKYILISHSPAVTAQGIAGLTHTPGHEMAKTVIVKLDCGLAMAVLPAKYHVDLALLRKNSKSKTASLATEEEFRGSFANCETGAMPPFGNLYGMPVFADDSLEKDREIAFNAGTHRELIRMAWDDYKRLAAPRMMRFAAGRSAEAA